MNSTRAQARTVAVVGAGRLGSALALALTTRGYRINALVANSEAHARRQARLFSTPRPRALAAAELNALPRTALLIIATPDDQIAATAARLAALHADDPTKRRAPIVLHTSGALSSDVLAPLRVVGCAVGSLHPLVSVSTAQTGAGSLRGAFYCIEGDATALQAARRLVRALAGHSLSIRAEDKALYHAAAVLAAGHTVALFDLASQVLAHCGVNHRAARRALLPLTSSTLQNLLAGRTPAQALTGPFARGDAATVRRNLAALAALDDPAALYIYALLGQHALELAAEHGLASARVAEIAQALLLKEQ